MNFEIKSVEFCDIPNKKKFAKKYAKKKTKCKLNFKINKNFDRLKAAQSDLNKEKIIVLMLDLLQCN